MWQTLKENSGLTFEKDDDLAYILIDGQNRFKICTQHKLPFEVYILSFESKKDAKDYMINVQLGRRNLNQNQVSYFRGLRYNNEKADKFENLKTNSSKGQNVPSEKTTAERLAKEYNVSAKTIKRDAEFAEGLEKIDTKLRNNISEGKIKIDKGTVQKLSKSQIEIPIKSIQELYNRVDTASLAMKSESKETRLAARVRESIKNAGDNDLTITIKGSFI